MTEQNDIAVQEDSKYTLKRPIKFEGEEVTELNLDFEKLNGEDLLTCVKIARQIDPEESVTAVVRAFTMSYQIAVAAAAAGVTPDLIKALKGADFTQVTQQAANFLISQG